MGPGHQTPSTAQPPPWSPLLDPDTSTSNRHTHESPGHRPNQSAEGTQFSMLEDPGMGQANRTGRGKGGWIESVDRPDKQEDSRERKRLQGSKQPRKDNPERTKPETKKCVWAIHTLALKLPTPFLVSNRRQDGGRSGCCRPVFPLCPVMEGVWTEKRLSTRS